MAVSLRKPDPNRAVVVVLLLALAGIVALLAWPALEIRPFDGDNLWILAWADRTNPSDLMAVDPAVYPEWRPLPYATIWLQYQSAGIQHLWRYQLVNLASWVACGWIVARIVLDFTGSAWSALAAGVIVLTSTQLVAPFVLIAERQGSLACLFGLTAWLLSIRAWHQPASRSRWLCISLLLAASAFCKEYGLAFSAAIAMSALFERQRPALRAAVAALGFYGVSRIVLAGGALGPYCEQHGFFFTTRDICVDGLRSIVVSQVIYNVTATGIGSVLPGILAADGTVGISPRWLLISAMLLAVAAVGWIRGPRLNRIGVFAVLFNAALSFLLYRSRNQVVAVCAIGVGTGVGLPIAWAMVARAATSPLVRGMVIAVLVAALATRALVMRTLVADRVVESSHPNACGDDIPDLDRAFMARMWGLYNLPLPECDGDSPNQ